MVLSSVLGFPRIGESRSFAFGFDVSLDILFLIVTYIGANREIKKAVEAYWAGKTSAEDLQKVAAEVRKTSWTSVKNHRVDFVPRCVYN